MRNVKILRSIGNGQKVFREAGSIHSVGPKTADHLVKHGYAEYALDEPPKKRGPGRPPKVKKTETTTEEATT